VRSDVSLKQIDEREMPARWEHGKIVIGNRVSHERMRASAPPHLVIAVRTSVMLLVVPLLLAMWCPTEAAVNTTGRCVDTTTTTMMMQRTSARSPMTVRAHSVARCSAASRATSRRRAVGRARPPAYSNPASSDVRRVPRRVLARGAHGDTLSAQPARGRPGAHDRLGACWVCHARDNA